MRIRGLIFDFDGTLFDSMGIWDEAGARYLSTMGIEAAPDLGEELAAMSLDQAAEYMKAVYHLQSSREEIVEGINRTVGDFYLYEAEPKAHVREMLGFFQERGMKMCIATATEHSLIKAALCRCELDQYFEKIFTCQEVGYGKDQPVIYEQALQWMSCSKEQAVVFEDACHAAKTAADAGFHVAAVRDAHEKGEEVLREISDIYIEDFACVMQEKYFNE